jgi:hypothetical protein
MAGFVFPLLSLGMAATSHCSIPAATIINMNVLTTVGHGFASKLVPKSRCAPIAEMFELP